MTHVVNTYIDTKLIVARGEGVGRNYQTPTKFSWLDHLWWRR